MKSNNVYLGIANIYAKDNTGCTKVHVGCMILDINGNPVAIGANKSIPNCKRKGVCHRVELYGENSKQHRLPSDCNAVHSEVDALLRATGDVAGGTAFVTRYPCEACARALVTAGIKKVVYGRGQEISPLTKQIFETGGVEVIWAKDWTEEDVEN